MINIITERLAYAQRERDMKEETMTLDSWNVEVCSWRRRGGEGNGVECRFKGGHRPDTNTAYTTFHAK